jgi:hypothetical protein
MIKNERRTIPNRRAGMKDKIIHQWRDWLLEHAGVGKYELIQKENRTVVRTILAKSDMDAENQCQVILNGANGEFNLVSGNVG